MKTEKIGQEAVLSRRATVDRGSEEFQSWALPKHSDWRLPSGEGLAEFALHAGFVTPSLLAVGSGRHLRRDKAGQRTTERALEKKVPAGGRR